MGNRVYKYGKNTLAVRAGVAHSNFGEHAPGLFLTSSFVYKNAADAAAHFAGKVDGGYIYSRFTNPTVRMFEQRLAALEGAERCVATASGMSAILAVCLAFVQAGDHVLCSRSVFGTTTVLFDKYISKMGVAVDFVDLTSLDAWQQAIKPNTRLAFIESPSNPLGHIVDTAKLAAICKARNVLLVVDNCLTTPALQQPLALGADIVMHSATKYIDGQGRAIGGAVLGSRVLMEEVYGVVRTCGPSMSPFNAWVFLNGLETLHLRMQAHSHNAMHVAKWLQAQPQVKRVHYIGLPTHPQHALAKAQQSGFGGIVSFEVYGGQAAAWQVIDHTELLSITANLGDSKSTITHPATTTHSRLSPEVRLACGIEDALLRVSVGLENWQDICHDLATGLALLPSQ